MRSATTSIESERDCPEKPPSSGQPRVRIMSIARDVQGAPASFGLTLSFLSPLSLQFLERFLQFANVVRRQLPGVRQLRHHRGRLAAEERRVGKECRSGWWPYPENQNATLSIT